MELFFNSFIESFAKNVKRWDVIIGFVSYVFFIYPAKFLYKISSYFKGITGEIILGLATEIISIAKDYEGLMRYN